MLIGYWKIQSWSIGRIETEKTGRQFIQVKTEEMIDCSEIKAASCSPAEKAPK